MDVMISMVKKMPGNKQSKKHTVNMAEVATREQVFDVIDTEFKGFFGDQKTLEAPKKGKKGDD